MQSLFDLNEISFKNLIDEEKPWTSLEKIEDYIKENGENLTKNGFKQEGQSFIHTSAKVDPSVKFLGPAIIDQESEISPNVLLKKGVIIGKSSYIGPGIELKHCIILNNTKVPHLSYIADSILGSNVNIGAGTITANWKGGWDNKIISLKINGEKISTEKEKFGALIGDSVYLGCNNVTAPGTVIGKNVLTYPLCFLREEIPAGSIVKNHPTIEIVQKQ